MELWKGSEARSSMHSSNLGGGPGAEGTGVGYDWPGFVPPPQASDLTNVSRIWPPSPSRAPILASRALQVLPDGVRNRLGSISDQILINDMASEPPESTNVASERLRDDECNLDLVSEPLKDNECIEDLASEQLGSWISDPRSPNPRYPPINTHPQTNRNHPEVLQDLYLQPEGGRRQGA